MLGAIVRHKMTGANVRRKNRLTPKAVLGARKMLGALRNIYKTFFFQLPIIVAQVHDSKLPTNAEIRMTTSAGAVVCLMALMSNSSFQNFLLF